MFYGSVAVPLYGGMSLAASAEPAFGGYDLRDQLRQLDQLALQLTSEHLEQHGNRISQQHRTCLSHLCRAVTRIADGSISGRFVVDLPPGLGKTTLVISWTKGVVALGFPWSVLICAQKVDELIKIKKALIAGSAAVPPDMIGLWHSMSNAEEPPTFPKGQEHLYATRSILLVTQVRLHKADQQAFLLYRDQPRNLVMYDESLRTTELYESAYSEVMGDIEEIRAFLRGDEGQVTTSSESCTPSSRRNIRRKTMAPLQGACGYPRPLLASWSKLGG